MVKFTFVWQYTRPITFTGNFLWLADAKYLKDFYLNLMATLISTVGAPTRICCKWIVCHTLKTHASFPLHRQQKRCMSKDIAPKNILELNKRGIFQDIYPDAAVGLPELLTTKKQCFYCGFDPTADSLHLGNFLSIMALIYCQRAGIVLCFYYKQGRFCCN